VAVARVFSFSAAVNFNNRQRTEATLALAHKMEEFKNASVVDPVWTSGGSLDPASRMPGFWDYVTADSAGRLVVLTTPSYTSYLRVWQISGTLPRTVTVIVYTERAGLTQRRMELIRGTSIATSSY
jgi:hypothetical protein